MSSEESAFELSDDQGSEEEDLEEEPAPTLDARKKKPSASKPKLFVARPPDWRSEEVSASFDIC